MQAKAFLRPEIMVKAAVLLAMGAVGFGILIPATMDMVTHQQNQQYLQTNRAMQDQLIDTLVGKLERNYVYADKARAMAALLRERQRERKYKVITSPRQLASVISDDLQSVSGDAALTVAFQPDLVSEEPEPTAPPGAEAEAGMLDALTRWLASLDDALEPSGVRKVHLFESNIGYVRLEYFFPAREAGPKFASTMETLAGTRALIIDLRQNAGGDLASAVLLASYFFAAPAHFTDVVDRHGRRTEQHWTRASVAGPRYAGNKKLVILTGRETGAAAEAFAYNMQQLGRATVIGDATRGSANPGRMRRIGDHFTVFIPEGRWISPITHSNWDGAGVVPDIYAPAGLVLATAQHRILSEQLK